jgi:hypothetical protein
MTQGYIAMRKIDRVLIGTLVASVWILIGLQVTSFSQSYAQESEITEHPQEDGGTQNETTVIHASEIVGLSAMIEYAIRDRQFRPQSMPGFDQYVKSIVRQCRISGSVTGDRISSTNISC